MKTGLDCSPISQRGGQKTDLNFSLNPKTGDMLQEDCRGGKATGKWARVAFEGALSLLVQTINNYLGSAFQSSFQNHIRKPYCRPDSVLGFETLC